MILLAPAVMGETVLLDSFTDNSAYVRDIGGDGANWHYVGINVTMGQTATPSILTIDCSQEQGTPPPINVTFQTVSGGLPSHQVVAGTNTHFINSVTCTGEANYTLPSANMTQIAAGTNFFIVLSATKNTALNRYKIDGDATPPFTNDGWIRSTVGTEWSVATPRVYFYLYGTTPEAGENDTLNMSVGSIADQYQTNSPNITFNVTVNGALQFNCTLFIDGSINQTNSYNAGTDVKAEFNLTYPTNTEVSDNYQINCSDGQSSETSILKTYYIDTVSPSLSSTLNNTYWSINQTINITATDTYISTLEINDSCGFGNYNSSMTSPHLEYNIQDTRLCSIGQKQTNITVCDGPNGTALNCVSATYLWNSMGAITFRALSVLNGNWINNFTISKNQTVDGSTTTGVYDLTNLTAGDYLIHIDALNWALANTTISLSNSWASYNFSLYTTNSINFTFFDEDSLLVVTNVSVELISDLYSTQINTTNGSIYVDLLTPSLYAVRYSSPNYFERFYYFNLTNRSTTKLELYLLSNSTGSEITATVYDESNDFVEDSYIYVLRYDIDSNSYTVREVVKTNFEGEAKLHLIENDEFYKFLIYYPWGTLKKETSPTYIFASSISFSIILGVDVAENFYNSEGLDYSLAYNNNTRNFRYTYVDDENSLSQACLYVYRTTLRGESLYNSTCSTSASSTLLVGVNNESGATYNAQAFAYFGSTEYLLDTHTTSFDQAKVGGNFGFLAVVFVSIVFVFVGIWSLSLALILFPLPALFGSLFNIIDFNTGLLLAVEVIMVITAFIISKRR